MAIWHCPHCGAPQAEASRCWVCRRSSTTCSTCRHFRRSLASDVGYCGKDRRRAPLTGLELRGCWEEGARAAPPNDGEAPVARPTAVVRGNGGPLDRPDPMRLRGFVPVDELAVPNRSVAVPGGSPAQEAVPDASPSLLAEPVEPWERRTSLFGEADA